MAGRDQSQWEDSAGDGAPTGAPAPHYFLTPHSFLCRTDGVLIFLDLSQDEYVCLEPAHSDAIGRRLGLAPPQPEGDGDVGPILEELVEAGLLTSDSRSGKAPLPIEQSATLREMSRFDIGAGPRVTARHVAAFLGALLVARAWLGLAPIERIVRRVARRRARRPSPPDPERARELTEIYRKLRPLFMSRKDQCLLNSLLLIEFLARFGLYPAWHFGVRIREFSAHCWVQHGDFVYDDDVENICKYALIMKV